VDRDISVRTPESIAFDYELAGLGSRFLALVIDQAIQFAVALAIFFAVLAAASRLPAQRAVAASGEIEKIAGAIAVALIVALIFTIFFGYFIAFETLWNGQTPGKKVLGIRVVRDGGFPLDFGAALIRNLIRVGEFVLGYYLLAAISTVLSPENKRLGDLAAGTIVVRDSKLALKLRYDPATSQPQYAPTAYLSGEERALIKRFLERRDVLSPEKRRELASKLANRVRERVSPELQRLDDESLLERL
jgi:uncharacterized RDD family membrane protein YckC